MKFSTLMYVAMNSIFQNLLKPNQTKFRIFAIENLKSLNLSDKLQEDTIFALRPEQLSVEEFISLTQKIAADGI